MHKLFNNTVFIGKRAFYLPSCHSTNEMASVLMAKRQPVNGTVIYTDYQTRGKGQRGNSWESERAKNILISIILGTSFVQASDFFHLTMITSLAIYDLLADYINVELTIKWPNDLMFENKKIGGILIENYIRQNKIEWCVVGVGLNVNQTRFHEKNAISLANICGQTFDRGELTALLLEKVEDKYFALRRGESKALRKAYLDHLYWKNEIHVFKSKGKFFNGKIVDVEPSGKLKMEVEDGVNLFDFKEVVFVR